MNYDHDQIFGLDCPQQSIPIYFWLNRPQQHGRDIIHDDQNFQLYQNFGVD